MAKPHAAQWLVGGALLLAAPAAYAQNSFNRWEATPVTTPTPARSARRAAATPPATEAPAPAATPAAAAAPAPSTDSAPVAAEAAPSRKLPDVRSSILRRGLGQRLRASKFSAPDAGYYEYAWEHLHYPESALSAGLTGQVMVRVDVNPAGDVTNSVVTGTSIQQEGKSKKGASANTGQAEMRRNAQELLWGLRFEPAARATQEEIPVLYVIQ